MDIDLKLKLWLMMGLVVLVIALIGLITYVVFKSHYQQLSEKEREEFWKRWYDDTNNLNP